MILNLLTFLFFAASLLKMLDFVYLFQIKEYRLDRFLAAVHDNGIMDTFLWRKKLPAKSQRNMLVAALAGSLLALWSYILFVRPVLILVSLPLAIPFSFICTLIGVYATGVIASWKRRLIITRAVARLRDSGAIAIGITGSYGKTTAKEYLAHILSRSFSIAKTEENMNTDVGVAISILKNVTPQTRYFIAEMGAYRRGEINAICDMVHPIYGIITGIGNQHLDLFGSRDNLISSKKELLDSLPENGKAYICAKSPARDRLAAGVKAEVFFFENKNEESLIEPCIMLARHLGAEEKDIQKAIGEIKHARGKYTPAKGYKGCLVIDNSYNTSREGFLNTISHLAGFKDYKKIIVSRGIIELGTEKEETYREIVKSLKTENITLLTTDPLFGKNPSSAVRVFENEKVLDGELVRNTHGHTAIAFEGKYNKDTIARMKHV